MTRSRATQIDKEQQQQQAPPNSLEQSRQSLSFENASKNDNINKKYKLIIIYK